MGSIQLAGIFFSGNNFSGTFFGWASIIFWSFSLCYTYTDIFHAINNGLNRTEWSLIRSVIIGMRRVWEGLPLLKMSRQF